MNNQNTETSYRVLILGNQCVGKTAIANAWKNGAPPPKRGYKPTVCDTYVDRVSVNGRGFQLELTDTAGLDEYSYFPGEYGDLTLLDYNAFIIVYAIDNAYSLEVAETIKCKLEKKLFSSKMPLLLVANKTDLESAREVAPAKGRQVAKSWQLAENAFHEVTATKPTQIKSLFDSIICMLEESSNVQESGKKICTIS